MASSWTSIGIVTRTVGLDVGTGRGGITRAAGVGAVAAKEVVVAGFVTETAGAEEDALRPARGPDLSQAPRAETHARASQDMDLACRLSPGFEGMTVGAYQGGSNVLGARPERALLGPMRCYGRQATVPAVPLADERAMAVVRIAAMAAIVVGAFSGDATSAQAADDAGVSSATLICGPVPAPGRVRCHVDAEVGPGEAIAWGDVVLVSTPEFVSVLRGRIGPHEATSHLPASWRWEFALVARGKGAGEVEGRARLVVCRDGTCLPRELPAKGRIVVGQDPLLADAGR